MAGRRVVTGLTLVGLLVLLAGMALWGYRALTTPVPGHGSSASGCTKQEITKQQYVRSSDISVSVYNAGARKHFAALTQSRLERRGFHPGELGNAPATAKVQIARVFTTDTDLTAAQLVARNLGVGVRVQRTDQEMGPGIDVYVGPKLGYLNPKVYKRMKLPKPIETCVKVS